MKHLHGIVVVLLAGSISTGADAALIAAYSFEGNANDVSGNGNDGTVVGALLTGSGFQGQAYEFRGSGTPTAGGDRIELPFNINPADFPALTMGAWVNSDIQANSATSVAPKAISHDDGGFDRTLGIDFRNGQASTSSSEWSAFGGNQAVVDSGISVTTGAWVFLAAVYDQGAQTVRLHVDGNAITRTSAILGSSALNVTIGKNPGFGSNEFWDGRIDNVFFFDEALSDAQIAEIRADPSIVFASGVPEPVTFGLFAIGLAGVGLGRRRARAP